MVTRAEFLSGLIGPLQAAMAPLAVADAPGAIVRGLAAGQPLSEAFGTVASDPLSMEGRTYGEDVTGSPYSGMLLELLTDPMMLMGMGGAGMAASFLPRYLGSQARQSAETIYTKLAKKASQESLTDIEKRVFAQAAAELADNPPPLPIHASDEGATVPGISPVESGLTSRKVMRLRRQMNEMLMGRLGKGQPGDLKESIGEWTREGVPASELYKLLLPDEPVPTNAEKQLRAGLFEPPGVDPKAWREGVKEGTSEFATSPFLRALLTHTFEDPIGVASREASEYTLPFLKAFSEELAPGERAPLTEILRRYSEDTPKMSEQVFAGKSGPKILDYFEQNAPEWYGERILAPSRSEREFIGDDTPHWEEMLADDPDAAEEFMLAQEMHEDAMDEHGWTDPGMTAEEIVNADPDAFDPEDILNLAPRDTIGEEGIPDVALWDAKMWGRELLKIASLDEINPKSFTKEGDILDGRGWDLDEIRFWAGILPPKGTRHEAAEKLTRVLFDPNVEARLMSGGVSLSDIITPESHPYDPGFFEKAAKKIAKAITGDESNFTMDLGMRNGERVSGMTLLDWVEQINNHLTPAYTDTQATLRTRPGMLKLGGAEFPDEYGEIIGRESLSATEFPQETPPPEAEWEGMVNERDASVPIDLPGLPEGSGHAVVYSQSLPHSEKYYQFLDPSGGDVEVVTGSEMFPGERQWLQEHGNFGDLPAPDIPSGEPGQHYLRHRRFVNLLLDPDTPGKAMTRGSKELPREALAIAESQQGLPIRAREMSSSVSGARGRQAVINHNMNHVKSAVHSLDSLAKEIAKDMVPDADGQYRLAGAIRVAAEELPGGSKPEAPDFSAMQLTPHPENPELNMWGVPLSEIRTQPELPGFEGGDGALARRLEEASPGITRDPVRSAKYFIEWLSRNRFIGSDGGVKPHDLGFTGQGGLSHLLTGSRDVSGAQFDSLLKDIYQVSESTYNNLLPPAESGNPTRLFVFGARSLPEAKGMYRQELERSGLLFSEDPAKRSQMIDRAVEEREYTSDPYKASPEKIGEKASVLEAIDHVRRNPHLEGILVPAAQTLKRSTFLPFGPKKDRSGKLQHARSILQYGHPKGRELSDEWSWVKSTDPEKVKYREDLIRKGKKGTMVKYIEHLTGVKSESVGAMGPAGSMRKDYEYIRLRDEGGNWYGPDKGRAVSKLMEFLKMGVPIIPGLSPFMMLQAMKDRR